MVFSVTALDKFNNIATGYSSTVQFTTSDGQAQLPGNSPITSGIGVYAASSKL